ncbi:AAA family ATPase [Paraburkholderia sediminicola]|uniref:UvrD-helicase domain-containing protein n=1 Tax=Paraburkholderia sediminicola TaxID=458836 RepID=UPI0038BD9085
MTAILSTSGNDRDAHVVEEILGYITATPPRNFFLFAGAGSGKTRTLVEVLRALTGVSKHPAGDRYSVHLRSRGQSVRVITYTKNATAVVNGRLGENFLADVSTIHSFCWDLIAAFDADIREALLSINKSKLDEEKRKAAAKAKGISERDREKFAEIESEAEAIAAIGKFIYHPDRNTYGYGALQHTQVLDVAAWLLKERPTLQQILTDRHPLVLIDESQDTMKSVLDSLLWICSQCPGAITVGLVGDHRQRIYAHGHSDLPSQIPKEWARPALQMNHRSQRRIVDLINMVWDAELEGRTQPRTGVAQHPRVEKGAGIVRIFVGDTNSRTDAKFNKEAECAERMAQITGDEAWCNGSRPYKTLALEHKLAARRGGFYEAYEAIELLDKDAASPQGNGENNGPSMLRTLLGPMLELAASVRTDGTVDEFASTNVLRRHGALQNLPEESDKRLPALDAMHRAVKEFTAACCANGSTVRDVLAPAIGGHLFDFDARLITAYNDEGSPPPAPEVKTRETREDRMKRGWQGLFAVSWDQISKYRNYLSGKARFATHQVVKGSEFKHVMVVMDDEDAGGFLFSYDKLFGGEPLSATDRKNAADNNETTIDRTLRLLYVTCSRAEESLALVLWARDREAALDGIKKSGWFSDDEVVIID